jgi:1,4-dihydroxy-2-naphthoyl-CoA hydrolase
MESKSSIWFGTIDLQDIIALNAGTLSATLGIQFTEMGPDYLVATMPVDQRTKQPFGLLHGGASVALAETLGSVATWCLVNREVFIGVGMEINANHLRPVTTGFVTGICTPLRKDGKVHVWEIKISDAEGNLSCISRFTCMVIPRR